MPEASKNGRRLLILPRPRLVNVLDLVGSLERMKTGMRHRLLDIVDRLAGRREKFFEASGISVGRCAG